MKLILFCCSTVLVTAAHANNFCIISKDSKLAHRLQITSQCREQKAISPITCESLSDRFCNKIWSDKVQGNFTLSEKDEFYLGRTSNGLLSYAEAIDLEALYQSACSLPQDLKKSLKVSCSGPFKARGYLEKMHKLLLSELNSKAERLNQHEKKKWSDKFISLKVKLSRSISEIAKNRTLNLYPSLELKKYRTTSDNKKFNTEYYNLLNQIIEAKYSTHPNWLRVQRVADIVKSDLIVLIRSLNISPSTINFFVSRVKDVKLSLPYSDPRRTNTSPDCSVKTVDAFYSPFKNTITVCTGYFNSMQSDASIYNVTAHEIAHSLDPVTRALLKYTQTAMAQLSKEVYKANGQLPCHHWKKELSIINKEKDEKNKVDNSLIELTRCFANNIEYQQLEQGFQQAGKIRTSAAASMSIAETISQLTTTLRLENGHTIENEFFFNPKAVEESKNEHFATEYDQHGFMHMESVFIQNLRCHKAQQGLSATSSTNDAINGTMDKTLQMITEFNKTILHFMAEEGVDIHQSSSLRESWSDWIATKAFEIYLSRVQGLSNKRTQALSAVAIDCRSTSNGATSKYDNEIEKIFLHETKAETRSRRLYFFTENISTQLNCQKTIAAHYGQLSCDKTSLTP